MTDVRPRGEPRPAYRRLPAIVLCALLATAALPATAYASTAAATGTTVRYSAGAGEANDVRAEPVDANSFRIRDSVAISAGAGCTQQADNVVVCSLAVVTVVAFGLGDGNDSLSAYETYADGGDVPVDADGGSGDDRLVAGVYTNADLDGGAGRDIVVVGDGGGSARGGDGDDQIEAGIDFAGSLTGGAGDDTFALVGYQQSVSGGSGRDMASYYSYSQCCIPSGVRVTLDGTANDGPAGRDSIGGDVEAVEGGFGTDELTGNATANTLIGRAGSDTLSGQAGDDHVYGEQGGDSLTGGAGADYLDGGPEDDRIDSRDGGVDSVICGSGGDTVSADLEDLVARDCENVVRPPGTPETREPAPVSSPSPLVAEIARTQAASPRPGSSSDQSGVLGSRSFSVRISRRALTLRRGTLRVRVACPRSESRLRGAVTLTRRASPRKLGRALFSCVRGRTVVAKVKLSARVRRRVGAGAKVRVSIVLRDGSALVGRGTRTVAVRTW